MASLFLHLGGNVPYSNNTQVNETLPPIIEKNVNREPSIQQSAFDRQQPIPIGQAFKPYQPNIKNIEQI